MFLSKCVFTKSRNSNVWSRGFGIFFVGEILARSSHPFPPSPQFPDRVTRFFCCIGRLLFLALDAAEFIWSIDALFCQGRHTAYGKSCHLEITLWSGLYKHGYVLQQMNHQIISYALMKQQPRFGCSYIADDRIWIAVLYSNSPSHCSTSPVPSEGLKAKGENIALVWTANMLDHTVGYLLQRKPVCVARLEWRSFRQISRNGHEGWFKKKLVIRGVAILNELFAAFLFHFANEA